jgi:hypothetical protein
MTRFLLAGTAAFGMMTCVAMAQMTTSQTTVTGAPMVVAPPSGSVSTTTKRQEVGIDGSQTDSVTRTQTVAPPPPPVATSTTQTTTTQTQ